MSERAVPQDQAEVVDRPGAAPAGAAPAGAAPAGAGPAGAAPSEAARLGSIVIDTDDPAGLARFYAELLGWSAQETEEDWIYLRGPHDVGLGLQLSIGHRAPTWPGSDVPQQMHVDFYVDDLTASIARALRLGARRSGVPDGRTFVTLIDPSGHPFCLCLALDQRSAPLQ